MEKKWEGIEIINKRNKDIKNHVIIFDIDDTIYNVSNNTIITPIFELYQYAIENGIYIVFITAREGNPSTIKFTEDQLKSYEIQYDLLYLRPPSIKDIYLYKKYARRNVVESGYTPLFSIGDMKWDIGEYGGIGIHIKI
jgi:predicted secreted acid phosphatase